ncbi:MAG TPA: hypothetical protein EYP30_03410 [Archaeoglobaceae archaeon]|nr:hypothetical protein [Archaeoglobaceae archaeon]
MRIVYDAAYPAISLLYGHILPYFSSKKLVYVVYSDSICRRLREMYKSLHKERLPASELLEKSILIKVGQKECYPFKREKCMKSKNLFFIPENRVLEGNELIRNITENITPDCIAVLAGFYLLPAIYGLAAIERLYHIFSEIPEETTLFSFYPKDFLDERLNKPLEKLFDVVVYVKKEDEFFYFGEEMYLIGIEQSIIKDIKPGYARFKTGDDWTLFEV